MKKLLILFWFLPLITCQSDESKGNKMEMEEERMKLYEYIMEYRKEHNLPEIPLSKSLNFVAQTHVRDLEKNKPNIGNCNAHSWSDKGNWTPVCYHNGGDQKMWSKMWSKPSELTSYKGRGFEIAVSWHSSKATPKGALKSWKGSTPHNNVILNKGTWAREWKAVGVGIYGKYASVWFGREKDTEK